MHTAGKHHCAGLHNDVFLICGKIIVATTMSAITAQFPQLMIVIYKRPHLQDSLQSVGTYTLTDGEQLKLIQNIYNCCPRALITCGKSDVHADEEPEDKEKRIVMSLLVTAEVLNKLDTGMRIGVVRCHYGVSKSSHSKRRHDQGNERFPA
jgi:hypothetical protein